ncbi:MAG: Re/Si-specific NAD(P)(+) transhydrogenase subunit alpha [Bacteroidetes bacterium]|nr:Re/Si-specific NAD(P)(+) transhydrogenase subunit alpha [Bacteroidota bacterium]
MKLGILKEPNYEQRVSLLDEGVLEAIKLKAEVLVEKGAGLSSFVSDEQYETAGAKVVSRAEIFEQSDIILQINAPTDEDLNSLKQGKIIMSMLSPMGNTTLINALKDMQITSFSMDFIPRSTRAQAMDVLSSMASVAGYKAVLRAAYELPHFFPMYITAAGSIKPSKVLILGAGVAGLQSIATSRRLGAMVEAFDVRSAAKEEVMSLGAKFVEVAGATEDKAAGGYAVEQTEEFKQKQAQVIADHASKADVIICTAQIPGRKAPVLITKETVERMKPGSVIIDLAASTGGNCAYTINNSVEIVNGVKIIGESNFPGIAMSIDASKMYGKNTLNFLKLIVGKEGELNLNFEDDIVKGTCITHQGEIINERVKSSL